MPKTEIAFQYDYFEKKWVASGDAQTSSENIEKLPTVLVAKYPDDENLFVYCQKHRRLEPMADENEEYIDGTAAVDSGSELKFIKLVPDPEKGEIYSAPGCAHRGLFGVAEFKKHKKLSDNEFVYIPFRWRIFQRELGGPINVAADVAKAKILAYQSMSINWLTAAYSISFSNQKIIVTQSKVISGLSKEDIPEIVVNTAIELLRSDSELECGIKPSVMSKVNNFEKLESFVERPFDLNIVYLKTFFKEFGDFDSIFPRALKDNYQKICGLLQISPPKSLRKAYTYNPYSIVWYMYLTGLGFSDINLIQPLLSLQDNLLGLPLSSLYYSLETQKVEQVNPPHVMWADGWRRRDHPYDKLEWVEFYAHWLQDYGKGKRFLHWLKEGSTVKPVADWQWDILRSFAEYSDKLSVEIKRRFLREGLTRYVHDIMSWEILVATSNWKNVSMEYPPSIMKYECRINGYEFHVVRETVHLTHLGHMFKNCVATYRDAVISRNSIIVSMQKDKQYVACIEIKGATRIVQALGVYNRKLTGDDLLACRYWARVHSLTDERDYLKFSIADDAPRLVDWKYFPLEPCREHLPKIPDGDAFECRIAGYEFHVVKENEQMLALCRVFDIKQDFFYLEIVQSSSIVSVQKDNEYVALLVVEESACVSHAHGVAGTSLSGDDLLVCRYWAKKHLLKIDENSGLVMKKNALGKFLDDWKNVSMEPCREEPLKIV